MKLVNNNDSITLSCRGPDPTHLTILCESPASDRRTEFSLNLISLDSENLGIPETSYQSEITMNSAEFSKLCRELYSLSETVTFEITQNYVKFAIDGEVGTGNILIKTGGDEMEGQRDAVALSFALRYLNLFNKAYSLANQVKISMSADTPLVVEYEVEGMGELKFYLAPKISEDAN
jgi:proliferating cell nuclear antigen